MDNLEHIPEKEKNPWRFTKFSGMAIIDDKKTGRRVEGNIVSIQECGLAVLTSIFGELQIGWNGKYAQWAFKESGGEILIFYSISPEKKLFVAGGYEKRILINDSELMFTPPGGFGLNKESHGTTARRETMEETGIFISKEKIVKIGEFTPNRAFWIKEKEGRWPVTVFAFKVDWDKLKKDKKEQKILAGTEKNKAGIDILSSLVFMEISEAISSTNDGIALASFAKALAAYNNNIIM